MKSSERKKLRIRALAKLLMSGKSQGECADALGVSRWTVNKDAKEARRLISSGEVSGSGSAPASPAAPMESSPTEVTPEELEADAQLDVLRAKARRGLDVGPQITVVLSRKVQSQLMRELQNGGLSSRDAASALGTVESARKSAEGAIDIHEQIRAEMAKTLLGVLDRVVDNATYKRVVKELAVAERMEG